MVYDRAEDEAQVGCRLDAIISLYPTKKYAADTAGISPDQLTRYVKGQSAPPFEVLARLASRKGVSLDWLATGQGPMYLKESAPAGMPAAPASLPGLIDPALYGLLTEAVSMAYKECGFTATLREIAAEAARLAADLAESGVTPEEWPVAIKTATGLLRRQLRQAVANPAASTKSRA
jgi:hypothetical protein